MLQIEQREFETICKLNVTGIKKKNMLFHVLFAVLIQFRKPN